MPDARQSINPPYISVNKLSEALNILSTHSFSQITANEFKNRGFADSDAFATTTALKFLKLINDDGSKTENLIKLQLRGEERIKGLEEVVRNAYSKLFEIAPNANKLSRNDLYNEFIAIYGVTSRVATTAVPDFLWLCSQAGLEVSEEAITRTKQTKSGSKKITNSKKNLSIQEERTIAEIIEPDAMNPDIQAAELNLSNGKAKILVPAILTEEDVKRLKGQIDLFRVMPQNTGGEAPGSGQ